MTPTNEAGHGLPELPDSVLSDLIDWHKRDGTKKGVFTTQALQELAAHRESLALSRGVPEGWKLVPIEPSWDMRNEGREFLIDGLEKAPEKLAYFLWKTMVAAAPEAQ